MKLKDLDCVSLVTKTSSLVVFHFLLPDIFKVYCADHTYTTICLPINATVRDIVLSARDKLCLGHDPVLCEVKSSGGECYVRFSCVDKSLKFSLSCSFPCAFTVKFLIHSQLNLSFIHS